MPSVLLALALGFVLASCGGSNPFSSAPDAKLKAALAPALGAPLADEVAAAWRPALGDIAKVAAAESARDFAAYHRAVLALGLSYTRGVDETIRILDSSADQSWRRRLLADAFGGKTGVEGEADRKVWKDSFPTRESQSSEAKAWLMDELLEHPYEAGELSRVAVVSQYDASRLSMYFVTATTAEAAKSIGEAYKGFTNSGQSQPQPK